MTYTEGNGLKLFYLGFAFPPGVQELFPGINPAGHALETQMVRELRNYFDVRSAGILPDVPPVVDAADPASGIAHEVIMTERSPELLYRLRSLVRLKTTYLEWSAAGWAPDLVLVYNLSPVYNQFLLWLRRQPRCPKLVLLLLDSPNLGQSLPWLKRTRRRFKPMFVPDYDMLPIFDAGVGLSRSTERYFAPRGQPFLWMPGGCSPDRALSPNGAKELTSARGTVRFGYHGSLGPHAGAMQLLNTFVRSGLNATLELCGYGKGADEFSKAARQSPNVRFLGLLNPDECLRFGASCDVLVNPRPATHGNENNFASKLFDYALSGAAILTSRLSGVESVLGPDACYFNANRFENALERRLRELAATPRVELARRGSAIQAKVIRQFSWSEQGRRLAGFMQGLTKAEAVATVNAAELAA